MSVSFNSTFKNKKTYTVNFGVWKLIIYLILTKDCIFVYKVHEFLFNNYISRNNREN